MNIIWMVDGEAEWAWVVLCHSLSQCG